MSENDEGGSIERQANTRARQAFLSGRTRPLEFRLQQLHALLKMIKERETDISTALKQDLNRSQYDTPLLELTGLENEIKMAIDKVSVWASPRPVERSVLTLRDQVYVQPQPLGVVLIIGAWNYPWALTLGPLVGAIAAGNAAVVKPSELSECSSLLLRALLPRYLDKDLYPVVPGGVAETQELLRQRWDHIFFTGSASVGRQVMEAAATHLTPVTLELGGKSPCYLHPDCNIRVAARDMSSWVQLGPAGSSWVQLGPVGSSWVQLGPVGSSWVQLGPVGSSWIQREVDVHDLDWSSVSLDEVHTFFGERDAHVDEALAPIRFHVAAEIT
ncbi:aldehyde dehydrogenase family 3 member A2-like [Boleophthalmus pectinirostris]|uniref:aldehyde dehydrogenase family 3 member A2-like n=1 Tax=Boleophthalmus pectinirostris TaxID=150288 RepID=UPI00242F80E7|nr:aldehyde dehydrogenase family 3 member A2-like [Boleophthalmus pectinirostris]